MSSPRLIAGRFAIMELPKALLGRGGMGEVYLATDNQSGQLVAVKALQVDMANKQPDLVARFVQEGEALRRLNHPNIVKMVAAVEEEGQHYLVMEYVSGGSLRALMNQTGLLPLPRVLQIALELADALARAHHLRILHRDLKPGNVLLAEDGTPRLTDFGIAHLEDIATRLTENGVFLGTLEYLGPEIFAGETANIRADIWAFGVMLFEMVTGRRPFSGATPAELLSNILTMPTPDPSQFRPGIPAGLTDLIKRMLEKEPAARIPSARLVAATLEELLQHPAEASIGERPPVVPVTPAADTVPLHLPPGNPYVSRGPVRTPQMFFGRIHELHEIAAFLQGNQSVSIVGPRKIGKTSLLFHLMRPTTWPQVGLAADFLFVYLDCEVLGEGSHEEIFGQFAAEMAAALETRQLAAEPALDKAMENPSRLAFETAVRRLNQRNLRVVLILDEFERLSTNPNLNINFFNALRSAAGRYQLTFLTASANPLIQLTYSGKSREILSSPFFNIFAQQFLALLPEAEAHLLITTPFQAAGKPITPETADTLYRLAGGHPFCLQVFCFHAYENPDQIDNIRQRATRELQAHFEYYWRNLSRPEQETLLNLPAVLAQLSQDTTLTHILRDLTHKCLLVAEGRNYHYASQAWADFVGAHIEQQPAVVSGLRLGTLSGVTLGSYEVQELLARGGMAEVYKGLHVRLGRSVAIKVLPQQLAGQGDFRRRFEQEARAVAALKHPNIVQVFDFGNVNDTYYLVMEYVDGKDLTHYLQEHPGPLPLAEALPILRNIASALDYAHVQGVIHRDIKPSNILLEVATILHPTQSPYRAILSDFGIAKLLSNSAATTGVGMMGTLDYMAPEQIQSASTVDTSADIYALGVLAYRMVTGVLPFNGENPGEVLSGHLYRTAPDPRSFAPELPAHCVAALQRSLAKEADKRFATASQLVAALTS